MGVAAAGVAVTALGDAALLDVAVSGALLAGAAACMPGTASSKALKHKGAQFYASRGRKRRHCGTCLPGTGMTPGPRGHTLPLQLPIGGHGWAA